MPYGRTLRVGDVGGGIVDDTVVIGLVLLLLAPVIAFDGWSSARGGFGSAFWRQPLEEKLGHIAEHRPEWTRIGIVWLPMLTLSCAGMTGFSLLLSDAGSGALAFLALGAFLLGSTAWLFGVLLQTAVVRRAAEVRAAAGATPDWLEAFWNAGWWAELTYVLAANVAFAVWGVAMLDADFPAGWAAWTMLVGGGGTAVAVAATRNGFPHLGVLLPVVLGVALVLS